MSQGSAGGDSPSAEPWLVLGLGNPGPNYAGNRHNIGYQVVDALPGELGSPGGAVLRAHKSGRADVFEGFVGLPGRPGPRVVLARGRTFMNESGGPAATLLSFYRIPPARLIVVHDELDLDLGLVRVKFGGGDNGHNGLRSLRASLGTGDFYRVRMGVGRPPGRQPVADFVLSDYRREEQTEVALQTACAVDLVVTLITSGLEFTQNRFHRPQA